MTARKPKTTTPVDEQARRYVDYLPLDQVQLAPRNPKGHHGESINKSIGHFGFADLPLLDERTGRLVAGHGRHEQLVAMHADGGDAPDGVRTDPDGGWLMPVIRGWASRSDTDAEAYLIASNQITTKGGWEERGLAEILEELQDAHLLDLTGFEDDDLARMLANLNDDDIVDTEEPPDTGGDPVSMRGDVWILGPHRLTCGDTQLGHADMLCRRFQEITGTLPVRQSTGVEYDFLKGRD